MCTTVLWRGKEISSVAELRAALGVVVIEDEDALREAVRSQGGDLEASCLCVVDIEATAALGGLAVVWDVMTAEIIEPDHGT